MRLTMKETYHTGQVLWKAQEETKLGWKNGVYNPETEWRGQQLGNAMETAR